MRLEVRGPRVRCYVDDERLFDHTDDRFAKGRVGFSTFSRTGARFRDIAITTPEGKVLWEGPPEIRASETEGPSEGGLSVVCLRPDGAAEASA